LRQEAITTHCQLVEMIELRHFVQPDLMSRDTDVTTDSVHAKFGFAGTILIAQMFEMDAGLRAKNRFSIQTNQ
jgi:hypothetical protein